MNTVKDLMAGPPVPGAWISAFIDNLTVLFPPDKPIDMEATEYIVGRMQALLLKEGLAHSWGKLKAFSPGEANAGHLSADQRAAVEGTELTIAGRGTRVVDALIGTDAYQKDLTAYVAMRKAGEVLRVVVNTEDV